MGNKWWFLSPLYWILAALPLMAAFWVFLEMPTIVEITPGYTATTGRATVLLLPMVNAAVAALLHIAAGRVTQQIEEQFRTQGRKSDAAAVIPGLKVFMMAYLSAICLAVVYGHYVLDAGHLTGALIGRISALIPGFGMALFAMRLSHATKDSLLALRWHYTEKSNQVWHKTHKLGAGVLYAVGMIMVLTAFLTDGIVAVTAAVLAVSVPYFGLYLYAKRLYEDEFYR